MNEIPLHELGGGLDYALDPFLVLGIKRTEAIIDLLGWFTIFYSNLVLGSYEFSPYRRHSTCSSPKLKENGGMRQERGIGLMPPLFLSAIFIDFSKQPRCDNPRGCVIRSTSFCPALRSGRVGESIVTKWTWKV